MAKMTKEVMGKFNDPTAIKVLATEGADGNLNNVPVMSLAALDDETLAFADMFLGKTKENLQATRNICAVAYVIPTTPGVMPAGFSVKGSFKEFLESGPIYDSFAQKAKEMGMPIKGVGIIKVDEGWNITPASGAYQVF